jgi:hypothetical protein
MAGDRLREVCSGQLCQLKLAPGPSKPLPDAGFGVTIRIPTCRGNAGLLTHKVQMLAPAGSGQSRFYLLTPVATGTYTYPFIWFHGCTVSS